MSVEEVITEIETKDDIEEVVKLMISDFENIGLLYRFLDKLNRVLADNDIHGTVARIASSFNHSVSIALMVPTENTGNLVINLAFMPDVKAVVEDAPETSAFSSLSNRFRFLIDRSMTPGKTLRLILEDELSTQRIPI